MANPSVFQYVDPLTRRGAGRTAAMPDYRMDLGPMSDEQFALLLGQRNSVRTRALRAQAELKRQQERAALLGSAQPQEIGELFSTPTTDRSRQLQGIANEDYLARQRGAQMGLAGEIYNQKLNRALEQESFNRRVKLAQLGISRQGSALDAAKFRQQAGLDMAKFGLDRQEAQNLQDYRNKSLGLSEKEITARTQRDATNQGYVEKRDKRADQAQDRNHFLDAFNLVKSVGLGSDEIETLFPDFNPQQKQMLKAAGSKQDESMLRAQELADQYNQLRLQAAGATPGQSYADMQAARNAVIVQMQKDPVARGLISYDPTYRRFEPIPSMRGGGGAAPDAGGRFADSYVPRYEQMSGDDGMGNPMLDESFPPPAARYQPYGPPVYNRPAGLGTPRLSGGGLMEDYGPLPAEPALPMRRSSGPQEGAIYRKPDGTIVKILRGRETPWRLSR